MDMKTGHFDLTRPVSCANFVRAAIKAMKEALQSRE